MSMNREQELQHRNDELLMKLTNVVAGYKQLQATIEQQAAKIAKLEERIRVADAEEPVGWKLHSAIVTSKPLYRADKDQWQPLYLHAQIPAEVELKAKIAELESSEKEGWRYADELEQERKRLEAIIKEQP